MEYVEPRQPKWLRSSKGAPFTGIGSLEADILAIVWEQERTTVRDVYETLRERRQIAYTTVMTMMKILEEKGHLKKRQVDRAYVYRPAQPEQRMMRSMVREFVDRVFDGSAKPLLVQLAKDRRLTEKERRDIARLLKEAE